jgi:hypothetical protein
MRSPLLPLLLSVSTTALDCFSVHHFQQAARSLAWRSPAFAHHQKQWLLELLNDAVDAVSTSLYLSAFR